MANFKTWNDVAAWILYEPSGKGANALRVALAEGRISGRNAAIAVSYLNHIQGVEAATAEEISLDLQRRSTEAAERSAVAAIDSAASAHRSLVTAIAAAAISVVALIVAVLQSPR